MIDKKTFNSTMSAIVTPKQAADVLGVSESSVKRWCDTGRITTVRTPGGHRRVAVAALLRFAAENGYPMPDLSTLGSELAKTSAHDAWRDAERRKRALQEEVRQALIAGDRPTALAALSLAWVNGASMDVLCDEVVTPAFVDIGNRWQNGTLEIYEERRAVELTERMLRDLGDKFCPTKPNAPKAIGASREHDPYSLPVAMAEVVLREHGFDASTMGTRIPVDSLIAASRAMHPRVVWLCVSVCDDPDKLIVDCKNLEQATRDLGAALILGGRALVPELRQQLRCSAFCEGMRHLASLAGALRTERPTNDRARPRRAVGR